jgi:hypothetical protein
MAATRRRLAGTLLALLLPVLSVLSVAAAGPANAADGFKYWNYFHVQGGTYAFAQTGPADFTPKDGTVEAYRYGLSSTAKGLSPRTEPTTYSFDDLCAGTEAQSGEKRVGVLIDFGTETDAADGETPPDPRGDCAVVPTNANGQQVLDAVADVRVQDGLVCGVDGYPAQGCSVTVKDPPAAQAEQTVDFTLPQAADDTSAASNSSDESSSDDGGVPWTLVLVAVGVVVIAAAALVLSRRNRAT